MNSLARRITSILILGSAAISHAEIETGTVLGPPIAGANFGRSVATEGDVMVVGAPGIDQVFPFRFENGQWTPDGSPIVGPTGSRYGYAIAYSNGLLAIGAPDATVSVTANVGRVFVFQRTGNDTWVSAGSISPSSLSADADFGAAIDMYQGSRLIIGEPGYNQKNGRAYIYEWNGTAFVIKKALSLAGVSGSEFGHSVAIDSSFACVGCPAYDAPSFPNCGAIIYYRRNALGAWTELNGSYFGTSNMGWGERVDIDATRVAGISRGPNGMSAGYVVTWNGTQFLYSDTIDDSYAFPDFKAAFSGTPKFEGNELLLTRPTASKSVTGVAHGALRISPSHDTGFGGGYPNDLFSLEEISEQFGASLGASPTRIVVGAPGYSDSSGAQRGRVHTYDRLAPGWDWSGVGFPTLMDCFGKGSLSANQPFQLTVLSTSANRPAFLVVGFSQIWLPFNVSYTLIPSPDIVIAGITTNASGDFEIGGMIPPGVPSGLSITFQYFIDISYPGDPFPQPHLAEGRGIIGTFP